MEPTTLALLSGLLGLVVGGVAVRFGQLSGRQPDLPAPAIPPEVATVLSVLASSALVVDEQDAVLKASAPAYELGLVRRGTLCVPELAELVRQVRRDGQIRETELVLPQWHAERHVSARVAPLGTRLVLILAEDRTHEHRVEAVRRDFVGNVSHELKTPVGALTVLAEAVAEAADDPEAVQRFADRIRGEATRLSQLVQQIIELSRLQGDDLLERPEKVDVDEVLAAAVAQSVTTAEARRIAVTRSGETGLQVPGHFGQLELALGNLVANAVAYSEPGNRVEVSAAAADGWVDLRIADRGSGIPAGELERIFERFYRVDPARQRSTGGTGLGLSIVKHVAASHGGEITVDSVEGEGSVFTLRLPEVHR